jgi:tetratricopeptide (TPR) repeat protein
MASNTVLYGIIGALGLAIVGGGAYIAKQEGAFGPPDTTTALTAPAPVPPPTPAPASPAPAPKPPVVAAPAPPPPPLAAPRAPSGPTTAQAEQLRLLVIDARRAITRGDFDSADRALVQAERIDPRSTDVLAARRDLRDAERQAHRGDRRIDTLVGEARAAIARRDWVAADRLLGQAEQVDPRDRDVVLAREELTKARQANRDNGRIDSLIGDARSAIARHDFAVAERLLNQAEQIDPRDRTIQQARAELANARLQADRENHRVDSLVAQARAAIGRHDYAAADRLLDQAENLDSRDRDVQQARAELTAAQRRR